MLNPNRELFRWGPIDVKVFYGAFFEETIWSNLKPWPWPPALGIGQAGRFSFLADFTDLRLVGEKYFRAYFLRRKNFLRHWAKWRRWVRDYNTYAHGHGRQRLSSLDTAAFRARFRDFYRFNREFWLIVHVPEVANWGGEAYLRRMLARLDPARVDQHLEILAAPVRYSFFQTEERELLQLARIRNAGKRRLALRRHARKYSWLLNSYGGNRTLTAGYFARKLAALLGTATARQHLARMAARISQNRRRKTVLARRLKLDRDIRVAADQLSQSIWWQDLRKGYIWRMHAIWDDLLREAARRTGWKFQDLLWCWPPEVLALLEGKRLDRRKILSRRQWYAIYFYSGRIVQRYGRRSVVPLIRRYLRPQGSAAQALAGLVVSRGSGPVQGTVKIIRNPFRDMKKMRVGDILVAGMTSPEFIIAMRKAAAIVTDHGGMTSHAAIVSRELGIPCIVGTRVATHAFKDGDRVEVDAERGIVRKIA